MWAVSNNTPFSADGYFIRDRDGKEYWCVAVRGRFRARPDGMTDLLEPQPIRLSPAYRDAEANELLADADFAPFRPAADILVNGSAVAPDEKPIDRIDVTVAVGTMTKQAAVTGEARMVKKARLGGRRKERASRVELSWRRSLGGSDLLRMMMGPSVKPIQLAGAGHVISSARRREPNWLCRRSQRLRMSSIQVARFRSQSGLALFSRLGQRGVSMLAPMTTLGLKTGRRFCLPISPKISTRPRRSIKSIPVSCAAVSRYDWKGFIRKAVMHFACRNVSSKLIRVLPERR